MTNKEKFELTQKILFLAEKKYGEFGEVEVFFCKYCVESNVEHDAIALRYFRDEHAEIQTYTYILGDVVVGGDCESIAEISRKAYANNN